MVPQLRQDSNYIIADLVALEQAIAIQRPDVDQAVLEQQIRTAQFALHAHWRFTYVEQNLARELSAQPLHAETVFEHPERSDSVMLFGTLVPLKRASLGSGRVWRPTAGVDACPTASEMQ
jgi:hypothetical protein